MGLDTSHDCWHGAYSAFRRFREHIAAAVGIPLELMSGFYEPPDEVVLQWVAPGPDGPECGAPMGPVLHAWVTNVTRWLPVSWDGWANDPVIVLLHHSDCEGSIAAADCRRLASRLEELRRGVYRATLERADEAEADWVDSKIVAWITGLTLAADAGEPVEFH